MRGVGLLGLEVADRAVVERDLERDRSPAAASLDLRDLFRGERSPDRVVAIAEHGIHFGCVAFAVGQGPGIAGREDRNGDEGTKGEHRR